MSNPIGLSHHQYVAERRERDPEFVAAYDEVSAIMDLALALADLRERRGLSQRALAAKSGIKQPMINRIERGSQVPNPTTLLRLLTALHGGLTMLPDGTIHVWPAEAAFAVEQAGNARDTAPVASASVEGG
jgi:DNA-binding XRE family transcriptional regulator